MPLCPSCGRENPDGFRHCGYCGAPLVEAAEQRRKLATLLFCDLSGSTAIGERVDAEAVRSLMLSYFDEMRATLQRHGGTVEKFVGDAVLAVFGVPETHEDDALRACRAALEMQEALAGLNEQFEQRFGTRIGLRIGVNSGEVVAGDPAARETFVTGDPVNVAARLEQHAGENEILLGEATLRLVRDAVEVEAVAPLRAKGKSEPLAAYRLRSAVLSDASPLRRRTPFVGRDEQVDLLERELERTIGAGHCGLLTVVGEPGVGKSRLVAEFASRLAGRAEVVGGRCLSYGEGITYWPVAGIVRTLLGDHEGRSSRAQTLVDLETHLAGRPEGEAVAAKIALLLGVADGAATAAEIAWAIRHFFAAEAERRPLVVVVEDIHWAEEALLELLVELAATLAAPALLVCLARPELLDLRPDWPVDIRLEPLGERDVQTLLEALVGQLSPAAHRRLTAASAGNPLFLEEVVGVLVEDGILAPGSDAGTGGDLDQVTLPPTLHALLTARLDRLDPVGRTTLERGSIEGEVFHRDAVLDLSPPDLRAEVPAALQTLTSGDLLRPVTPTLAAAGAFRFKHILLRDAAYAGIAKLTRAELHERFAGWLEELLGEATKGYEEILGYHLEQSYRYRTSLGPVDDAARATADRAADWLDAAGRNAHARGDSAASERLFAAARDLASDAERQAELALRQGIAAREATSLTAAREIIAGVLERARGGGWVRLEAAAEVELGLLSLFTSTGKTEEVQAAGERALATFDGLGDEGGRASALALLGWERWRLLRCAEAESFFERALAPAERAGDSRLAGSLLVGLARAAVFGPRPAPDALARCTGLLERAYSIGPMAAANIAMLRTLPEAQLGNFAAARRLGEEAKAAMQEFETNAWIGFMPYVAMVALLGGDAALAERELRGVAEDLGGVGEHAFASTVSALRARAQVELGRFEEARGESQRALELAEPDDAATQAYAHAALARSLAAEGRLDAALAEARLGVGAVSGAGVPDILGDVRFDLALVQHAAGAVVEARATARGALELFRAKGNIASGARVEAFLA